MKLYVHMLVTSVGRESSPSLRSLWGAVGIRRHSDLSHQRTRSLRHLHTGSHQPLEEVCPQGYSLPKTYRLWLCTDDQPSVASQRALSGSPVERHHSPHLKRDAGSSHGIAHLSALKPCELIRCSSAHHKNLPEATIVL